MILMRESIWWLLATGLIGLLIGYGKGIPRWGFVLGVLLGPIGCGLVMMLPSHRVKRPPGPQDSTGPARAEPGPEPERRSSGPTCPRCHQPVSSVDKVCPKCGNVLVPVRYRVHDTGDKR